MPTTRAAVYANKATKVAHSSTIRKDQCRESEIKPANRERFKSWQDAANAGFKLCKNCFPDILTE